MIGTIDYKGMVKSIIEKRNKALDENVNTNLLPVWMHWYNGFHAPFHNYFIFNGRRRIRKTKKQLKMAKKVCEDWASLIMSEKVQVVLSRNNEELYELLTDERIDFWQTGSNSVEVGFALGYSGLAIDIEGLKNENGKIKKSDDTSLSLSYFPATQTVPTSFRNRKVVECAFVSENTEELQINWHYVDKSSGNYHIAMIRRVKGKGNIKDKDTIFDFDTGSPYPLFALVHPNIMNNIDVNSSLPISIYANSIDTLQAIDNKYEAFDIEFVSGKKRTFVSSEMQDIKYGEDEDGNEIMTLGDAFDPNDQTMYIIPADTLKDGKPLIYTESEELRTESIVAGINEELNILSNKVGLGANYYRFDRAGEVTATQVISENSDTFRNLKKHEKTVGRALQTIVRGLIYCNNTFTTRPEIVLEMPKIVFDDGIIEDKDAEKKSDRIDVQNGVLSKIAYRMKYYGEDEETARKAIYDINGREELITRSKNYMELINAGLMTPEMFINLAYTDDDLKEAHVTREQLIAWLINAPSATKITPEDLESNGGYTPPEEKTDTDEPQPGEE